MLKIKSLLTLDNTTPLLTDLIFLFIPLIWIGVPAVYLIFAAPPKDKYGGPGFVDGSAWISTVFGMAVSVVLVVVFAVSLCRIIYRFKHRR